MTSVDVLVVGGGAAGIFGAIRLAELRPGVRIVVLEKSNKVLSKVKVSGGGRCNVTHACYNPFQLADHYPRGGRALKNIFKQFDASGMVKWLAEKGVALKTESDGRMFPATDRSQTIIDCFMRIANERQIEIHLDREVESVRKESNGFVVTTRDGSAYAGKFLLVATGGSPKPQAYEWIRKMNHKVLSPIPSLFTFNESTRHFADLMGVSISSAEVRIEGTKFSERGPLLVTHWGFSGPAVIRLSAWAAEFLHERNYHFRIHINWTTYEKEEDLRTSLDNEKRAHPKQRVAGRPLFHLPVRLWERLCEIAEIEATRLWGDLSKKQQNKLIESLFRSVFQIKGKTTFKEEFVTCGGVDLSEVSHRTMESLFVPGLFFAGEVLNIDGETGGFNFQAAWTTAHLAACEMAKRLPDR